MVDGYGSRIQRESEELRVDGAWHFPICDHNGIKRTQSPSRKVRGDRDFKAGSKIRSEERYPATQRQQSIVAYVDSTGAVSAEYEYDPFGKVIAHTGRDFDFLFSTKFYDPDIGMYYYGYRHYSPELRRWASPDPIGEAGGPNLYGFCGNSPVDQCDMWGLIEVTEIPEIMRANSWTEGADLMEKWLSAPVNTTTTVAAPSVDIVKMNWVLGFANAKSKYEEIFSKKLYATEAARREIKRMVILTRLGTDGRFCDLSRSVLDVEKDYVTHQAVPSDKTLDGLTAALGGFSFHIAVSGIVKNNCAYIDSVGVYVHDRYDFIDRGFREKWIRSQDLGAWNKNTKTVSYWFGGDSVNNKTFRKYQKNTLKGGDFDIFSDIKIRYLNQDERFSIQLDKE